MREIRSGLFLGLSLTALAASVWSQAEATPATPAVTARRSGGLPDRTVDKGRSARIAAGVMAVAGMVALGGRADAAAAPISATRFVGDAKAFLEAETAAHITAVSSLDPPPPLVLGVPTKGDFTWGSFMRAIAEVAVLSRTRTVAGRELPPLLGQLGLIEARQGGKTFAQLGAAITLQSFGMDLAANPVWQGLRPAEQAEWRSLLDPARFYDRTTRQVINLPENYLGVAARIVAIDYRLGLVTDRAFVDDVLDRAAGQFKNGALYADDHLPTGRYDRYSQEYARFVYEAADLVGRKDVKQVVAPALTAVMRTWWDLVSPDGCSYPWGRTIGAISYMDTLDIIGFLARYPEFRPAPLPDLAALYVAAWEWLQRDYQPERHLLDMFGFGRGNYSYMSPERQWQQTTSFLAKAAGSLARLEVAVRAESVASLPPQPRLGDVARFEWFRRGDRPAGVWLVRQGALRFALPITTGPEPGIADYLPAPHGLPGFAAPVEQKVPALTPYLELPDGRTIAASDGADEIHPGPDGRSLRVVWRRWAVVADPAAKREAFSLVAEAGRLAEPDLTTEVSWALEGDALVRRETLTAGRPLELRRLAVMIPSTGDRVSTRFDGPEEIDRFDSNETSLEVAVSSTGVLFARSLEATGNSALGRGARGPIPLILHLQAADVGLQPGKAIDWTVRLRMLP